MQPTNEQQKLEQKVLDPAMVTKAQMLVLQTLRESQLPVYESFVALLGIVHHWQEVLGVEGIAVNEKQKQEEKKSVIVAP